MAVQVTAGHFHGWEHPFRLLCWLSKWLEEQFWTTPSRKDLKKEVPFRSGLSLVWTGSRAAPHHSKMYSLGWAPSESSGVDPEWVYSGHLTMVYVCFLDGLVKKIVHNQKIFIWIICPQMLQITILEEIPWSFQSFSFLSKSLLRYINTCICVNVSARISVYLDLLSEDGPSPTV